MERVRREALATPPTRLRAPEPAPHSRPARPASFLPARSPPVPPRPRRASAYPAPGTPPPARPPACDTGRNPASAVRGSGVVLDHRARHDPARPPTGPRGVTGRGPGAREDRAAERRAVRPARQPPGEEPGQPLPRDRPGHGQDHEVPD